MKTPDGKVFKSKPTLRPLLAAGRAMLAAMRAAARLVWRAVVLTVWAIGKTIATIWRLAGALDAALWQGAKLIALRSGRILALTMRLALEASRDFLRWLPSRSGRAYSAFSAFVLVIALLWIADELSISRRDGAGPGEANRAPVDLEDPILARIEGRYVHLSEIEAAARAAGALREEETLTPQTAFERQLVEAYVEQKLLSRAAMDEGLQRRPDVARQIGAVRDRILAAAFMEERIKTAVTEEAIERLYRRQADVTRLGDEVRARQIVVATQEDAEAVLEALKEGASFEDLARNLSLDRSTAAFGGDLGYFTRDVMTPELASAAFTTPVGELAAPFKTEFGWHVLEVLDRRPTNGVPLAAVKDNIGLFLRRRTITRTLDELKDENEVVYYRPAEGAEHAEAAAAGAAPVRELRPGGY